MNNQIYESMINLKDITGKIMACYFDHCPEFICPFFAFHFQGKKRFSKAHVHPINFAHLKAMF